MFLVASQELCSQSKQCVIGVELYIFRRNCSKSSCATEQQKKCVFKLKYNAIAVSPKHRNAPANTEFSRACGSCSFGWSWTPSPRTGACRWSSTTASSTRWRSVTVACVSLQRRRLNKGLPTISFHPLISPACLLSCRRYHTFDIVAGLQFSSEISSLRIAHVGAS